jgi:hypothetical protein
MAVTGEKAVTGVPTVNVLDGIANSVANSLLSVITDRLKLALAVCPAASVKVTTKVVFPTTCVGVPVIVTSAQLNNLDT